MQEPEPIPSEHESQHHSLDESELDAVIQRLNENHSDIGVERGETLILHHATREPPSIQVAESTPPTTRSTIPSRLNTQIDLQYQPASQHGSQYDLQSSPVRQLNKAEFDHVSDWDEAFSAGYAAELQQRSIFFDSHVNNIIGGALDERLVPLERALGVIQHSVGVLAASTSPTPRPRQLRSLSADVEHSDADDEDDEELHPHRSRSPLDLRDRRMDRIKQAVLDALSADRAAASGASSQTTAPVPVAFDISELKAELAELKELAISNTQQLQPTPNTESTAQQESQLKDAILELKEFVVAQSARDHQSRESFLGDAVLELKQLLSAREVDKEAETGELKEAILEFKKLATATKPEQEQKDVELRDSLLELKQLITAKPEKDNQNDELKEAIMELGQLVVAKPEPEQYSSELRDDLAELKQLVASKPESEKQPNNELNDAVSGLKDLLIMKLEQDQGLELRNMFAELKQLTIEKQDHAENNGLRNDLAELKELVIATPTAQDPNLLREVVAEVISSHPKFATELPTTPRPDESDEHEAEKLKVHIDGLQSMLRMAEERAEDEYKARRRAQDNLADSQRLLRVAEEAAAVAKQQFQEFKSTKLPELERVREESTLYKREQENLHLALSELSDKNISLRSTLDEYKSTRDRVAGELKETMTENDSLRNTIRTLKQQMESNMQSRQNLREKFDRLQEEMITASQNIAQEQSQWRRREEDYIVKYNTLHASYEREAKERQKLELHISELEEKEKEGLKLKFILEQSQEENAKLEESLMNVRQENHDLENHAARSERELSEARDVYRQEVQRVRSALETDLQAAKAQVKIVRSEFEAQIENLESRLEDAQRTADNESARQQLLLEEAADSKRVALQNAAESKELALQELRLTHERTLNDLRERHARALHNASEDKQRDESHYMELLAIRDEKVEQLQDKLAFKDDKIVQIQDTIALKDDKIVQLQDTVALKDEKVEQLQNKLTQLEEKLEIAKSAARAAAQAAQTAKNAPAAGPPTPAASSLVSPTHLSSPSMTFAQGSSVPERISPQALRESIMVLQDQLQQREGRIEELEQELSAIDKEAPNRLKDKETEVTWLRELLGVRIDDLQDIINTLSQPSFNHHAVKDAAIRLRANLQMQQQERERAMSGANQPFPSLASISSLAASPRALPLAAAAAWGNWRKGRENSVTSVSSSSGGRLPNGGGDNDQTPSKAPTTAGGPQGFFTGLMTPPNSNFRQTPTNNHSAPPPHRPFRESRPLRSSGGGQRGLAVRTAGKMPQQPMEPPTTPPLLRKSSYDHDAQATSYDEEAYMDDESLMGGMMALDAHESPADVGPFGPAI